MRVKFATWNVNSINQRIKDLSSWVKEEGVDVLCLQEIKCIDSQFPEEVVRSLGFNFILNAQKGYNGVAILSKYPITLIYSNLPNFTDQQARYIEAIIEISNVLVRVASVYVPNGKAVHSSSFEYKLHFFKNLYQHLKITLKKKEIFLVGGDYNVAPENIDVYDPKKSEGKIGFHIEERKSFRAILNLGLYDAFRLFHPALQEFSWWDYRGRAFLANYGMRLDIMLISPKAADILHACKIIKVLRATERPSDHVPVLVELNIL